jgi:hypothetical protein
MDCSQRAFLASQAMYSFMLTAPREEIYIGNLFAAGSSSSPLPNVEGLKNIAAKSVMMADLMMAELKKTEESKK